jgi:hypothetical protein
VGRYSDVQRTGCVEGEFAEIVDASEDELTERRRSS